MSQNPLVDTTTSAQSSKTPELKPALAAALASLEVKLDQELARYRRTRTVYKTPSQPRVGSPTPLKPQQLTVLSTAEGRKPVVEENGQAKQNKFEAVTTNDAHASVQQEELSIPDNINTPSVSIPETQQEMPVTPTIEEVDNLKMPSTSERTEIETTQVSNYTSIIPRVLEEPNNSSTSPEDFLESSEALLRSLTEAQPNTDRRTISSSSLLSPLGIGSMLLLLLASLTFGFIVFNSKSSPVLSLGRLWPRNVPPQANKTKTDHEPKFTPIPKYPNLAESEFPEVKDPNDVVGLKPKPKPIIIASPDPTATPQPTSLATKVPYVQPITPTITPPISTAVTPNLSSQQLDAEIKPSKDGFYHVVAENQGVQALPSARKVIPDAYLSKDGKFIYLGALKDKEKAQQLLQELREKGIQARIQ